MNKLFGFHFESVLPALNVNSACAECQGSGGQIISDYKMATWRPLLPQSRSSPKSNAPEPLELL